MGLTSDSTGIKSVDNGLFIEKSSPEDKIIALAGNPNVGKSTVFNELTGMKQHTGNWPGKTVSNAQGNYRFKDKNYIMVDIPGTYSLMAHSVEEEVARDFICFGEPDTVIVVCDATCLERNLNLVLQTIEITESVVVCVNLMDEARKKNIRIDFEELSERLGVPVVGTSARSREGLEELMECVASIEEYKKCHTKIKLQYIEPIEKAIHIVEPVLIKKVNKNINKRWIALKLIDEDVTLLTALNEYLGYNILKDSEIYGKIIEARAVITDNGIELDKLKDKIVAAIVHKAEELCSGVVCYDRLNYNERDRKIDKILTSKSTGIPLMLLLLAVIFWLTITGANYPSQLLSTVLFHFQDTLIQFFAAIGAPEWFYNMLVLGVYRVLAWVVSVMLPPMAIFFPLFTLLEDLGYLPRIAFNLDKSFKKCNACGKQALTM